MFCFPTRICRCSHARVCPEPLLESHQANLISGMTEPDTPMFVPGASTPITQIGATIGGPLTALDTTCSTP